MTQIDQIIADALTGSPETHVAILARDVLRLREAPAVVVPDDTFTLDLDEFGEKLACITINSKNRGIGYELCGTMGDGHFSRRTFNITPYLAHCLNTIGVRSIPADRVLGDGMVQVDQKELMALESLFGAAGRAIHAASSGRGATLAEINEEWAGVCAAKVLRANQGGA